MTGKRQTLGRRGEELACSFLVKKGYRILARNYRTRSGEIDIIARDGAVLVFVEVKTRNSERFGHPFEAVTFHKQQQMIKVAREYICYNASPEQEARFDVVGIVCGADNRIELIQNAFDVC